MMTRAVLLLLASAALSACASNRQTTDTVTVAGSAVGEAMAQPLKDLNLVQDPIPSQLRAVMKDPYAKPERVDCPWLEHEVGTLDLALGPDVDVPVEKRGAGTQGAEAVGGAAANAIGGLIPFRSMVRQLTGAEKNAAEMKQALHAGDVRRAYLKGLGLERGCAHPAAPAPLPMAKNAQTLPEPADAAPAASAPAPAAPAEAAQPAAAPSP